MLVATPNLQRSSLVVAGRLADRAPAPSVIVEQLITAGGGTVAWEDEDGVPTTDWPNPDATPRRVAIVGDRHFVIARGQDMPRVLAIALARVASADTTDPSAPPPVSPADALVALPEGAAITIEIEGARAYVRQSPCRVPTRLAARADEVDGMVRVSLHAVFDSEDESAEAAACFDTLRARALGNPIVSFMGFGAPLGELEIQTEGASLEATTRLSYSHIRSALRYAQGMFRRGAPAASPGAAEGGAEPTPVPPPSSVAPVPPPPIPPPAPIPPPTP